MVMSLGNKAVLKGISTFPIANHCFSYTDYKEFYYQLCLEQYSIADPGSNNEGEEWTQADVECWEVVQSSSVEQLRETMGSSRVQSSPTHDMLCELPPADAFMWVKPIAGQWTRNSFPWVVTHTEASLDPSILRTELERAGCLCKARGFDSVLQDSFNILTASKLKLSIKLCV